MRSIRSRSRLVSGAALGLLMSVTGVVLGTIPAVAQDGSPAAVPTLTDVATEGGALATRFLGILALSDAEKVAELEGFLAPEFQLVRATGDRLDRAAYLAKPASVHEFAVSDVVATQAGDVVVVSYLLAITETIDGVRQTTTAPRLSVFHWSGTDWQLAAHSNFGAIATTIEPSPKPAG